MLEGVITALERLDTLVEADKLALGVGQLVRRGSDVAIAEIAVGDGGSGEVVTDKKTYGKGARGGGFFSKEPAEDGVGNVAPGH